MCVLPAAVALRVSAQGAAAPEKKIPVENAPAAPAAAAENDELLVLSPFTVSTKQDIGYRASSTLAGSRLNSKIDDLAAPITVVTKQQLEDTGSRDHNDVFLYEANTEGSMNYTKVQIDRSSLKDNVGGTATNGIGANTSQTANRIRGLVNADMTWNYYYSIQRVRGDVYNADSLEISRGPNSILAGLGSPSGIVNQSLSFAHVNTDTNQVNLAIGSFGSNRVSLSSNQTLLKDKLAIYVAALYDDRRFERKPSYDISRRQTGGFTFKPTTKTTIKGFIENYSNSARLPNAMTPIDGVTSWLNGGRPTWDPLTKQVTFLDTGVTSAPYLNFGTQQVATNAFNSALVRINGDSILTDRRSTLFVPGMGIVSGARATREINPDGSFFWTQSQATVFNIYGNASVPGTALNTAAVSGTINGTTGVPTYPTLGMAAGSPYDIWSRRLTSSAAAPAPAAYDFIGSGAYIAPAVSNKSIYDWRKINIAATNHGEMRNSTYNLEFEQQLTPDLYFATGWFRQDLDSLENYPMSQTTAQTIFIDTNKNLPSGQSNPNYLRPYVESQDPDTARTPESSEVARAMLAYNLDFTKKDGWSKWLGRHKILGFAQHWEDIQTQMRYRIDFTDPSDPRFVTPTVALGGTGGQAARVAGYHFANTGGETRQAYYIGNAIGSSSSVVTAAPSTLVGNPATGTIESSTVTAYNYATGAWEQAPVSYAAELLDAGGGFQRFQRTVSTFNLTAQSYWWNDRIITTVGVRRDRWMGRNTTTGTDANGNVLGATTATVNNAIYPYGSYRLDEGTLLQRWAKAEYLHQNTKTFGIVAKPLPWFSLHANKSENFNPPTASAVDIFGRKLPTPTGESKDYGFSLNLLDGKLVTRLTLFNTSLQADRSNGSISTLMGRIAREDNSNLLSWAQAVVRIRSNVTGDAANDTPQIHAPNGTTPTTNWTDAAQSGNALSANQTAIVNSMMGGLSSTWPDGATINSTQDAKAKGAEFEVIYNPTPSWNIKLTAAKQETTYNNIIPEYESWLASRLPVWTTATATGLPAAYSAPFTDASGKLWSLTNFWTGYGFGETNASTGTNGYNPNDWYTKVVSPQLAGARALQNAEPYGQRKWHVNVLTNYMFTHGILKNFAIGGAVRWEDKAVVGYRGIKGENLTASGGPDLTSQWVGFDPKRPVYDTDVGVDSLTDLTHLDLWVSYSFKMWSDKIRTKIQLNVQDATEGGRLAPVYVNFDGTPAAYRIIDSRRWTLSAKFDF